MSDNETILALSSNEKQALVQALGNIHYKVNVKNITLNLFVLELITAFDGTYALTNRGYRIACAISTFSNEVSIIEED